MNGEGLVAWETKTICVDGPRLTHSPLTVSACTVHGPYFRNLRSSLLALWHFQNSYREEQPISENDSNVNPTAFVPVRMKRWPPGMEAERNCEEVANSRSYLF